VIRRRSVLRALVAGALLALAPALAAAQPAPPGQRAQRPQQRALLEERFRQRLGAIVQRRLGLDDAQALRLRQTNQRFEGQRRELLRQERDARQGLRRQLAGGGASANQQEVARLLDAMLGVHRRRLEIAEAEQRELATFLTPVQRAKYFALQDELRRRMQEMRRQRGGDAAPPG
jgi:periplasmic protein CpxP/Spy